MKDKVCIFNADSDVAAIDCNVCDAEVRFVRSDDSKLSVVMPDAKNVHAGNDNGTLLISQTGRTALFARRQKIVVRVPEHIVPSLAFNAKKCDLEIEGSIYKDITLIAESGDIAIRNADAESLEINGDRLTVAVSESTFKGNLYVNARAAEFTAQNAYAGLAVIRTKRGNMGLIALTFRDCALETDNGSITATLVGKREDFNMRIVSKSSSDNDAGLKTAARAEKTFNAYTAKGNIVVCFVDDDNAADELVYADDDTEEKIPVKEI